MTNQSIELKCKDELTNGFELAIKQLGYEITDCNWDDENGVTNYVVVKK